ncbi:MAG: nucleotide exchange factor GrpE [Halofilum sp. (in: g-proteobacteria)]|nr:nucleotide exchange factor GrpE [Halofilum sp. (in: g-proteobacteria)]
MSKEQSVEQPERERTETVAEEPQAGREPAPAGDAGTDEGATPEQQQAESGQAVEHDDEVARLRARLEETEAKAKEYWDRLLRTEAEKENARKRAERDAEAARRYAVENFASELLAVRDSLELGLEAARQEEADLEKIREGTELTHRMLTQLFEKFHIEEIDPVGQKFDPELHQAMSMQEVEGSESNTVISVMQKGYRLNDRLLRPALVMVAK